MLAASRVAIVLAVPLLAVSASITRAQDTDASESKVWPADRVTHYRACERLGAECVRRIAFPEGTQSYYFRWKQCEEARTVCVKQPVPQSALDEVAAAEANKAEEARARKAEKAAAAAAERAAREERVFPELATEAEIAAYNATAAPDDQLVCRPQQLTGSHRTTNICRTKREIRETEAREQDEIRRQQNRTTQGPEPAR